jgi:hypothetical protein
MIGAIVVMILLYDMFLGIFPRHGLNHNKLLWNYLHASDHVRVENELLLYFDSPNIVNLDSLCGSPGHLDRDEFHFIGKRQLRVLGVRRGCWLFLCFEIPL